MNWYLKVLQQYFDFTGRARRKEYWIFTLVNVIIGWVLDILEVASGLTFISVISVVYSVLVLIPTVAVSVRRLHDIGKSGWYYLLIFLPIIGWIWLLILFCMDGEERPNQWGDNPKGLGNDIIISQIGKE